MARDENAEGLTDGERAYLRSGDTSGLTPDQQQEATAKQPDLFQADPPAADPAPAGDPAPTASEPPIEPGEVIIDERGNAHRPNDGKFTKKTRMVPHEALHSERERAKALEKQLQEARESQIRYETQMRMLTEAAQAAARQQQPDEPANPLEEPDVDPNVDLFAAVEQERRRNRFLAEQQQNVQQGIAKTAEEQALANAVKGDAMQFAQAQPDFWPAYRHLLNTRGAELELLGLSPQAAEAQLRREEQEMVRLATKRGMRPAQYLYQMAGLRGWNPAMAGQGQPAPGPGQAMGGQQPAPQPAPASPAMARMQQQAQNRAQFTTLSGGGGAPTSGVTLASMVDLPPEEFSRKIAELGRSEVAKLLGYN